MLRTTSCTLASKAARRSGVSSEAASVSRLHSISPSGRAPPSTSAMASRPPERNRSSGSWPSGDRAKRGALAGLVAVEAQDRLVGHLPDEAQLLLGQRGAERGDRRQVAGVDHRDDVDIALHDDQSSALMHG